MAKVEAAKVEYAKAAASGSHRKRPQDEAVGCSAGLGKRKVARVQLHFN